MKIGIPISYNKTLGPATKLNFVGLTADLVNLCIFITKGQMLEITEFNW